MSSFSRDTRVALRSPRRDSLSQCAARQRPRLLRSSATEPSITTSNAIRAPMSSSSSPQKATDLLSRVVICSSPPGDLERPSSPGPVRRQMEAIVICRDGHQQSPTSSQDVVLVDSPSGMLDFSVSLAEESWKADASPGYYFSFPSFDNWNRDKDGEDIEKDMDD